MVVHKPTPGQSFCRSIFFSPVFSTSMGIWKRSWPILYWLPTGIFFFHNVYNIKVISGPSMQVRIYSSSIPLRISSIQDVLASQPSILILLPGEILQYLIVLRSIRWDYVIVTISLPSGQSFIILFLVSSSF